jgi:WD40 repeat protein
MALSKVCSVALGIHDDHSVVVTGCWDGSVRVIDLIDSPGESTFIPAAPLPAGAVAVADLRGRPVVVSGYADGTLRLTDLAEGTLIRQWPMFDSGSSTWVSSVVTVELDDRALVAAIHHDCAQVWDLADGALVGKWRGDRASLIAGHVAAERRRRGLPIGTLSQPERPGTEVTKVTVTGLDGRPVVVSGHQDGTVYVWDLASGQSVWGRETDIGQRGLGAYVDALAVNQLRGWQVIVVGGSPGVIGAWDLADGTLVVEPFVSHEPDAVRGVAIAELEGRTVMAAAGEQGTVRVWDVGTHEQLDTSTVAQGSPDAPFAVGRLEGRLTIVCGVNEGGIKVWHPASHPPRKTG